MLSASTFAEFDPDDLARFIAGVDRLLALDDGPAGRVIRDLRNALLAAAALDELAADDPLAEPPDVEPRLVDLGGLSPRWLEEARGWFARISQAPALTPGCRRIARVVALELRLVQPSVRDELDAQLLDGGGVDPLDLLAAGEPASEDMLVERQSLPGISRLVNTVGM